MNPCVTSFDPKEDRIMPINIRRKDNFRTQMLVVILLAVLAGIIGGGLVGLATRHPSSTPAASARTS